jgi:hypothetical protein
MMGPLHCTPEQQQRFAIDARPLYQTSRQHANSHATPHEGFAFSDTTLSSQTDSTDASESFDGRQPAPFPATIHPVVINGSRR